MLPPGFGAILLNLVLIKEHVHCLQQIYYKTLEDKEVEGISYDPSNHIYPVINLTSETCPFIPLQNCRSEAFFWETFEEHCKLSSLCPNGTDAQCVENSGNQFKHVLLVCAPKGNCNPNARNIVYYDSNKPSIYQLGQDKCEDGYHHARNVVCFGKCDHDKSIIVLQKSSLTSRAIVYCNYHMGYCNSEKPKIFELTDDPNICVLSYNRYKRCPHGLERLSDCSCKRPCHDGGYTRDPYRDFVCTRKDSTVLISPSNSKLLTVNVRLQPVADGLQLSYSYSIERDIIVYILKILYRKMKGHRAMALPDIVLDADGSPQHVDIKPLHPGRSYLFKVTLFYKHNDNMENRTIQMIGTAQPNPVRNLTSSYNSESIQLSWKIPHQSEQDRYGVEYRPVRRNRKPGWIHNTTRQCNFTISHPFPGEEYELRVYSISNATNSLESTTCLVIPPLPPQELHVHFPQPSVTDVDVFWFTNDSRSHVEKWILTYNTSNGDGDHMDVSYPDHGGRVVASLAKVQRGHIYNIFVYGVVGDVRSALPAYSEVKIPDLKEDLPETSNHFWIYVGVFSLIFIAVIMVIYQVFKKVPIIRNIRNVFHIERIEAIFNGGSNININLDDGARSALNNDTNEADDQDESGESDG